MNARVIRALTAANEYMTGIRALNRYGNKATNQDAIVVQHAVSVFRALREWIPTDELEREVAKRAAAKEKP